MSLLNASRISFRHPSQVDWLFSEVSFEINPGDRIGLVGPNGAGKTSLLRLLTGELLPAAGTLITRQGLRVGYVPQTSDQTIVVQNLTKAYGAKRLFENLSFSARRGERRAILGPNGSGKTTLLRILLGQESPDAGRVGFGANVKVGYYAQEGENLDPARSPVDLCRDLHGDETWCRTILGCLRLRGEQTNQPIGAMSAGERGKVALARLLLSGANLLLLDEPTNHLDIEAREAVEATLAQYPGTILFVSHDRTFAETLADETLDLAPGQSRPDIAV